MLIVRVRQNHCDTTLPIQYLLMIIKVYVQMSHVINNNAEQDEFFLKLAFYTRRYASSALIL